MKYENIEGFWTIRKVEAEQILGQSIHCNLQSPLAILYRTRSLYRVARFVSINSTHASAMHNNDDHSQRTALVLGLSYKAFVDVPFSFYYFSFIFNIDGWAPISQALEVLYLSYSRFLISYLRYHSLQYILQKSFPSEMAQYPKPWIMAVIGSSIFLFILLLGFAGLLHNYLRNRRQRHAVREAKDLEMQMKMKSVQVERLPPNRQGREQEGYDNVELNSPQREPGFFERSGELR